jgi:hypothetical protein
MQESVSCTRCTRRHASNERDYSKNRGKRQATLDSFGVLVLHARHSRMNYPKLPIVTGSPEDQQRIVDYIANNPGARVEQKQPIEYEDRVEFISIEISN